MPPGKVYGLLRKKQIQGGKDMDNKHDILQLLRKVADGSASPEEALLKLKEEPFEDADCIL